MRSSIIIPRALHNWDLALGAKNRVKIQAWQTAKAVLSAVSVLGRSTAAQEKCVELERRILSIQETGFKALALSYTIMLVEDSPLLLDGIEKHIRKLGFNHIVKFTNPLEAIKAFKSGSEKPQLVITDQSMPELLGHELIQQMGAIAKESPPRFITFSGDANLLEADNPAAPVFRKHSVLYIQKGVATGLFTLSVLEAAIEVARGIPPTAKTLLIKDPIPMVGELLYNPIYQFSGRIVHKTNNLLAAISVLIPMAIEEGTLAEDRADLMESATKISSFAAQLATFARTKDFSHALVENSALPKDLAEDPQCQKNWDRLPPDQRFKFAIITDQYLQNGLAHFSREANEIMELLFAPDAPPADLAAVSAKLAKAVANVTRLNNAVHQKDLDDPLTQLFANYYRLLKTL